MMMNLFNRRYERFKNQNNLDENEECIPHFEKIIGFNESKDGKVYMELNKDDSILTLFFKYEANTFDLKNNYIYELPKEINFLIAEYLPSFIELTFSLNHITDYPFKPPVWCLISCNDKLSCLKNSKEYYEYIVEQHNNTITRSWSPAITFDKDILYFASKLNYFDHFNQK
jgi:hypothetical protein